MLILHHLTNSRSQRIIWLLEELALDYSLIIHEREPNTKTAGESLKKLHPLGKAPLLCDGDLQLAESAAIMDYLLENYGDGKLEPARKTPARIQYLFWRHFAEGSLMPYLAMKQLFARIESSTPWIVRPIIKMISGSVNTHYLNPNLVSALDLVEKHLTRFRWFAGEEFSVADITIGFMLQAVHSQFSMHNQYPNISAFVANIHSRPAFQRAQEKGIWSNELHKHYWACLTLTK